MNAEEESDQVIPEVEGAASEEKPVVAEGDVAEQQLIAPVENKLIYGKRILVDLAIASTIKKICESTKKVVSEPIWPDPDKEPLPAPLTHSIVRPPPNRKERQGVTLFSIWTPKDGAEEPEADKHPEMHSSMTRWILQPKESKKIYVKFFSKNIGNFDQIL